MYCFIISICLFRMITEIWSVVLVVTGCSGSSFPNIVLVTVDGLGWGDLGPFNVFVTNTPNINDLSKKGITYLDFHSGGNIGSPSSAALFTGRYGQRNGVHSMFYDSSDGGLPLNEVLLPQLLKTYGYRSGFIGSWDLGHNEQYFPTKRGFEYFYGVPYLPSEYCGGNCSVPLSRIPLFENSMIIQQPATTKDMSLSMLYKKSIDFMKTARSESTPFLLVLSIPHLAFPSLFFECNHGSCSYSDMVKSLDELIGDIYKASQKDSYPLFMFMSKYGPVAENCNLAGSSGPYRGLWQVVNSNGGSRTCGTNWEGGHRVPLIVVWENKAAGSLICNSLTSSIDVVMTIKDILSIDLPGDRVYDGEALLPCPSRNRSRVLYLLSDVTKEVFTFRYGKRKVFYATRGQDTCTNKTISPLYSYHNPPLVFDVQSDALELFPIALAETEIETYLTLKLTGDRDLLQGMTSRVVTDCSLSSVICCNRTTNCTCSRSPSSMPSAISFVRPPDNSVVGSSRNAFGNTNNDILPSDDGSVLRDEDRILALYGFLFICLVVVLISISVVYSVYIRCFRKVVTSTEREPLLVDSFT